MPNDFDADFTLSNHASVRLQQRGIPAWYLALLIRLGKRHHAGGDAVIRWVDKAARRRFQQTVSREVYARSERYFDVYAVVAQDQTVVTAARRHAGKRFH